MDPDYVEELLIRARAERDAQEARERREASRRRAAQSRQQRRGMIVEDADLTEIT